jgi:hypothetical protein
MSDQEDYKALKDLSTIRLMLDKSKEQKKGESKNPPKNDASVKTASKELK